MQNNPPFMAQLEHTLEQYLYHKAPHLPTNWREVLVKIAPYLTILFVVLSVPVILAAFGVGMFLSPVVMMGGGASAFAGFSLAIVLFIVSVVLEAMAIPGLFNRSKQAWRLLFYSTLVNAIYNFVTFNLFGFILGTALSLYILFQIKSYYTH